MSTPNSKRIAGLVGPTVVAVVVSEFPLVQPHLYDAQIPPVVYLSVVVVSLKKHAIVRAHNHWALDWSVIVTLCGWLALGLGLFRMFAAEAYQRGAADTGAGTFMIFEGILIAAGVAMTVAAYRRG